MLNWPDSTLFEAIGGVAERRGDDTALVFEGETVAYDDLLARVRSFAHGLSDRGIGHGDTVAIWLANRPEWVIAQLAASALGAQVVAVNTRYRTHELAYMLEDSGASAIVLEESFLGRDYLEMLTDVAPSVADADPGSFDPTEFPDLETVVAVDPAPDYAAVESFEAVERFEATSEAAPPLDPVGDGETPVVIFYTSGTTGDPKGCVHGSRSVLNHSYNVGAYLDVTEADVGLGAVPFCGSFGYNVWLSCLTRGIPLVVQPHFEAEETVALVDRHDVTYFSGTAQMYLRMIDADGFAPDRVDTLRRAVMFFANGYNEPDFERIEAQTGVPICQPYGLSEANTQIFVGDPAASSEQRKKVGGPLVHEDLEARIVDPESRAELPDGERGELALRGYNVMQGYLDAPAATAEVFDDGWFYTGDLCERDEAGRLYYHSRIDDALRVRGFLVSPGEIEAAIEDHSAVTEAQVVGAPHPTHGQVPVAFVTFDDGATDADALLAHLDGKIADYKVPEEVLAVEEFPRTEGPHGAKIQKNELRERVADRYE